MQFIKKILIAFTLLVSFVAFSQAETTWITKKKNKSESVEKKEITTSWIKKKKKEIKKNKKEFKKEEKKIAKEVKSWITKKSKDEYKNINDLPEGAIYFSGYNETRDFLIYGYVEPDTTSELIDYKFYKTSKGYAYFNDGKTTCKVGSTVLAVIEGEITSRVSGKCKNGITFTGKTTQTNTSGDGYASSSDGNKFFVNFDINKGKIAKLYNENISNSQVVERKLPTKNKRKILLKPNGNYYALLIGNSKYDDPQWVSLVSPVNDIREIKKVLEKSYKFKKIITVENGTKKEILKSFQELKKLSTSNDYVLVYYSGHGEIKTDTAYWIPKDGGKEWGMGDWINISDLDIYLKEEIKAHHLAVLVDSCYVGGKFKGLNILDHLSEEQAELFGGSLVDGLNLRSRSVLSSGSNGRVSDTAPGTDHSLFALSLLTTLKQFDKLSSPINLQSIALNMKIAFTGTWNKPILYNPPTWEDGGGDFIFIPKGNLKQ